MIDAESLSPAIQKVEAARRAALEGDLQTAVSLIMAARADLADALWLLERKIAREELMGAPAAPVRKEPKP